MRRTVALIGFFLFAFVWFGGDRLTQAQDKANPMITEDRQGEVVTKMIAKFGEAAQSRIDRGTTRVASLWRKEDGTEQDYEDFCLKYFVADPAALDRTFTRLQTNLEALWGNMHQISRTLTEPLDLDLGDPLPIDYMFAKYSPQAHVSEDFFKNKIAFVIVLNFPYYNLEEKLTQGENWTRKQWAYARMGDLFTSRVPADVSQKITETYVEAGNYISEYNIFLGNLLTPDHKALFLPDLKLISHWGLRDELKAQYADADGLSRQRMIYEVMGRIIDQSIPKQVINNSKVYWDPKSDQVFEKKGDTFSPAAADPENPKRYAEFLSTFHAEQLLDPYVPANPTLIDRRFNENRQIPEKRMEQLLLSILSSPTVPKVAKLIEQRLGRKLEAFDIWYDGFKARGTRDPAELDRLVREKYPDVAAFQRDLPNILQKLGFSADKAAYLGEHIVVDPARGSGHAMGAAMRSDKAHLRTRATGGLNYKGYNIAIHELGHTVEQVFSLNEMDYFMLSGVPNTAFTEAFAFVFQDRDLPVLGLPNPNQEQAEALAALDTFWGTYEIAGVALVDMRAWRWMYANPQADAGQLRDAVQAIARDVWNEFYAPALGVKDTPLLAIYSHMIDSGMYLPDYPLGHIISFQIERYLKGKNLGAEMERMCRLGQLTPARWMEEAVGSPLSAKPLIDATEEALASVAKKN
jgi:hypothetical protein